MQILTSTGTRSAFSNLSVSLKLVVDPARTHNTTVVLLSPSRHKSAMVPPISSVASWPEVQLKVGLVLRLLRRSLNSLRACHHIWVALKVHQASTPLLDHHSTLVATSPVLQ